MFKSKICFKKVRKCAFENNVEVGFEYPTWCNGA
jgi:hypothetical protein